MQFIVQTAIDTRLIAGYQVIVYSLIEPNNVCERSIADEPQKRMAFLHFTQQAVVVTEVRIVRSVCLFSVFIRLKIRREICSVSQIWKTLCIS